MDRLSGKRSAAGIGTSRKGHSRLNDAVTEENPNGQFCNRIGCHGRIKYSRNTKVDNVKLPKPSIPSAGGISAIGNSKKSNLDSKRKLPSKPKCDSSESGQSSSSESPETVSSPPSVLTRCLSGSSKSKETGTSSVSSNIRPKKSSLHNREATSASGARLASDSSFSEQSNGNRYSLRNLKSNKVSSRPMSATKSSLESINVVKKRSLVGESSSSRLDSKRSNLIEEGSSSVSSVSTRRTTNEIARGTPSLQQNGRKRSSSVRQPPSPANEIRPSYGGRSFSTSRQSSSPVDDGIGSSVRLPGTRVSGSGLTFGFHGRSGRQFTEPTMAPHDLMYRHRMDEIAEVLLALEGIEQDDELSHERVLALETSLLLGSLNLYDQHRDMRLDIDNMSYEELLALEERMGTVSTALSEEALSNCLERITYQPTPSKSQIAETGNTKCTICQEEYEVGDELGKLVECQHFYHEACINQWLRLKNWCPVCKGSAAPSHKS